MKSLAALFLTGIALAQTPDAGRRQFDSRCASCHGGDGAGGEHGPAIVFRLASRTDQELKELIGFMRTLRPRRGQGPVPVKVETVDGRKLDGMALNLSSDDMQLQA